MKRKMRNPDDAPTVGMSASDQSSILGNNLNPDALPSIPSVHNRRPSAQSAHFARNS